MTLGSVAAGAGRECAPAALIRCWRAAAQLHRYSAVTKLLVAVLSSAVACGARASGGPIPWGTDLAVITATLTYFLHEPDAGPAKLRGYIAVAPQTDGLLKSIPYEDYYRTFATLKNPPPRDAFANYLDRNQQTYPLGAIPGFKRSIRLEKHDEPWSDITPENSKLRNYLIFRAPGYSSDGASAFVTFDFCCHLEGAEALYVLRKVGGNWTVASTEYRYGLEAAL